jgi:hypothetical protein
MTTEPIRQDIESIRESMTDKMEQIESKVRGTVENTVSSVKETFDLKGQVAQRPWTAVGAAVLAGFALGTLGGSSERPSYPAQRGEPMRYYPEPQERHEERPRQSFGATYSQPASHESMRAAMGQSSQGGGLLGSLAETFGDELTALKAAAMAAAMNAVRDILQQNLPRFADEYNRVRDEHSQGAMHGSRMTDLHSRGETPRERAVGEAASDSSATYNRGGVPNERPATYGERAPGTASVDTEYGSSVGGQTKDQVRSMASSNPLDPRERPI